MEASDVIAQARGAISARRVFGKPYAKDGVVVIPVAKVGGGGGGGRGGADGQEGSGFGFGMVGQPVGAYVIKGERVKWKPVVDVNALLFRAQAIGAVVVLAAAIRRRRR